MSEDEFDFNNLDTRELIISLRGGMPSKCDFCQKDTPPDYLDPEEAGEWVCYHCSWRWNWNEGIIKVAG